MKKYDYLIIGSGLAGVFAAHKAAPHGSVLVITKKAIRDSNSYNAQGGIAAVITIEDNPSMHFDDTIEAGRGLCEYKAVNLLVNEGPKRVREVIDEGMKFDMENGKLALGLEGGHHKHRILHAGGDSTGKWLTEFVIDRVLEDSRITIQENTSAINFLIKNNICYGVRCWNHEIHKEELIYANHVILTSGGTSALYSRTTNPETTIGDGIAMAYSAGCKIMDMEFIQFHPTSLYIKDSSRAFLISEAVRGEGAYLLNKAGERFMLPIHPLAELAPRDVVARSIFKQMEADQQPYVTLSLSHINPEQIKKRFPTLLKVCSDNGYNMLDKIPVAPAAHYTVGGIETDINGLTSVKRLYVCGEAAATGVMGANRLASNSLLECLVYGNRSIEASLKVEDLKDIPNFKKTMYQDENNKQKYFHLKKDIAEILRKYSGIIRVEEGLGIALNAVRKEKDILVSEIKADANKCEYYREAELKLLTLAELLIRGARFRKESRGGHYREDYPATKDEYLLHSVQQKDKNLFTSVVNQNEEA
ncbi:MAG: L-aspartate oxidase [Bacteroidales bacterium]